MKLIALVAVAVLVNGTRTTINPGEEVTGLNPVDAAELKRIGAVQDEDEARAEEKASATAETKANREFAQMRKSVQASAAAIEAGKA